MVEFESGRVLENATTAASPGPRVFECASGIEQDECRNIAISADVDLPARPAGLLPLSPGARILQQAYP